MSDRFGAALRLGAAVALGFLGCAGSSPTPSPADRAAARRHLQQGLELMRDQMFEAAGAELRESAWWMEEDNDLRFHRARLGLLGTVEDQQRAFDLLRKLIDSEPHLIRAPRLLMEASERLGDAGTATAMRDLIRSRYGEVADLELAETRAVQGEPGGKQGLPGESIEETRAAAAVGNPNDYQRFLIDVWRMGGFVLPYDPEPAVADIEDLFRKYPDLAALRIRAGDHVRLARYPRHGDGTRSATDSQWSLEVAQLLYERALDQLDPYGGLALVAQRELASLTLDFGDFVGAERRFDIVLEHPALDEDGKIEALWLKGVAEYLNDDPKAAVESFMAAIAVRPELRVLWNLRLALEKLGRPADSVFPLRPDRIDPDNPYGMVFHDIAPELGIAKYDGAGPSAWGDFDLDGDFDLFVAGCDTFSILYRNDGDRFTDASRAAGLEMIEPGLTSTFVDYDNDGDPDLYIARNGWNGPGPNSLYENQGDGTFLDVTARSGLGDPGSTFVHVWTDFDRDGYLDLIVANGVRRDFSRNHFYRNNGDGTFADVTEAAGLAEPPGTQTIGAAVGDYDRDGWPDIFFNGYRLESNRLYHNLGDGTFEETSIPAGVHGGRKKTQGYVAYFFDYNNDTWPDLLATKIAGWKETLMGMSAWYGEQSSAVRDDLATMATELYRNNGDGTFTDVSRQVGFLYPHGVMGAAIADLDNDGFQDIYLATGAPALFRLEPNILYRATGKGGYVDVTEVTGVGHLGKGHGFTFYDYGRDGLLDIYAPQGGFVHGDLWANAFYQNRTRKKNHWFQIRLQGTRSNRDAIGAQLTVKAGPLTMYREVTSGGAFAVTNEPVVAFGLGANPTVDRLTVRWPSGTTQDFEAIAADRRLFLREGGTPEPVPRP